jgi:hypothetical protein
LVYLQLAHVTQSRRRSSAKLLTKDETRRIAANVAKLQAFYADRNPS